MIQTSILWLQEEMILINTPYDSRKEIVYLPYNGGGHIGRVEAKHSSKVMNVFNTRFSLIRSRYLGILSLLWTKDDEL